jgi:hypothetical protein
VNETIKRFTWLTPVVILLWYCLYGWGLTVISAPLLYWAIALAVSVFLGMVVTYSFLICIPAILAASIFVVTPLALNVIVIRGSEEFANSFQNMFLFGTLTFAIAILWFSPLFWSNRVLAKNSLSQKQVIGFLTGCSWVGLGLGRILGVWY